MKNSHPSTATQDGVALMKAFILLFVALMLVVGGSLLAAFSHWLAGVPFWILSAVAVWKTRPALVREFRETDNAYAHPIAVYHTSDEREPCSCCGNPTLEPDDDTCRLCDWPVSEDPTEDAPSLSLATARKNFRRYLTVYSPDDAPDWVAFTEEEQALKRRLVTAYGRVRSGRNGAWFKARSLEAALTGLRYRLVSESEPD